MNSAITVTTTATPAQVAEAVQRRMGKSVPADGPYFRVIDVSPALAQQWLLRNEDNRSHRESLVRQYADDMTNKRWQYNGEPLHFSVSGRLLNGQHRLKAILRSQTTQVFNVGFSFPEDAQLTIDNGARRTASDSLKLAGVSHTAATAAVAKLVINERAEGRYLTFANTTPTTLHIQDVVLSDQRIADAAAFAQNKLVIETKCSPSVLGYTWWKTCQLDEDAAKTFYYRLRTLDNLGATSPILALSKRLVAHRLANGAKNNRQRQTELITYVFQAWNAWRRNEDRVALKAYRTDDGRLRAPKPV